VSGTTVIELNMPSWFPADRLFRPAGNRQHGEQILDSTAALNDFLAVVEKRAYRMAQLATGNPDEALDIVQDAMLVLAKKYAGRDAEEWGPLFHRIMQNRIRDWYRRQKVRNPLLAWLTPAEDERDPIENLPGAASREPARQVNQQAMLGALETALQALPLRQQQVFLLRVWEGLDVAETAHAMNISSGSVKTHYSRAVHKLREQLDDYHETD